MKTWYMALLIALMLAGCAGAVRPIDLSNGATNKISVFPTHYQRKAALIGSSNLIVKIISVDGIKVPGEGAAGTFIYVKPGNHILSVQLVNAEAFSPNGPLTHVPYHGPIININFDAKENTNYVVKVDKIYNAIQLKQYGYVALPFNGTEVPVEEF